MRKYSVLVLLLAFGACNAPQKAPAEARAPSAEAAPSTSRAEPDSQAACRARCNGVFAQHGMMPVAQCLCRTHDFGKVCASGGECEGQCLFDSALTRVVEPGPPQRGYFGGRCSEFETTYGCKQLLPRSKPEAPVELEQAPATICID
jgi:hypothetical protein